MGRGSWAGYCNLWLQNLAVNLLPEDALPLQVPNLCVWRGGGWWSGQHSHDILYSQDFDLWFSGAMPNIKFQLDFTYLIKTHYLRETLGLGLIYGDHESLEGFLGDVLRKLGFE